MKKLAFLFVLFLASCAHDQNNKTATNPEVNPLEISDSGFVIDLKDNEELDFEFMRIYPIIATDEHIAAHAELGTYQNLKEAFDLKGFRITERKPFGRFDDSGAVNNLTVQNKSTETVYLMAGDVVKGGNQDRVLAQDMVLPPRTLANIEVFCVEKGRWEYRGEGGEEMDEVEKKNRKVFAFSGYYNVVSNDIRKTVKNEKDQGKVWAAVGELTAINNADSNTGTYTALEDSKYFTAERNRYLAYFEDKMEGVENVIGMVVVSGNEVLGTDIFNHPQLFKKQYQGLLHAYVADAMANGAEVKISNRKMESYAGKIQNNYTRTMSKKDERDMKFRYDGRVVHFSDL